MRWTKRQMSAISAGLPPYPAPPRLRGAAAARSDLRVAHRHAHPGPHVAQGVHAVLLAQEGGDDPDDEGGFYALSESDDKGRQQALFRIPA